MDDPNASLEVAGEEGAEAEAALFDAEEIEEKPKAKDEKKKDDDKPKSKPKKK
jgi:hypothetical protein